jgi:hypothetical protein
MTARMSRVASFGEVASAVRVRDKAKASGSGAPWSIAALRARESIEASPVDVCCTAMASWPPGEAWEKHMPALTVGGSGVAPGNVEILMAPSRIAIEVASREGGASGSCTTDDWSSAPAEESPPDLLCVLSIPPGGLAQARYICRRLRAKLPATPSARAIRLLLSLMG